jgi:RimJ/RimL family protein N-acetyltransferase
MTADATRLLTVLTDDPVHLEPLGEDHREPLRAATADDEEFWPLYPRSFGRDHFDASFAEIVDSDRRFAVFAGGVLVGMTGYLNIDAGSAALEIGGTYLARAARGTGLNTRVKRLLIDHAVACGFHRIAFRIDARNARSQAAVAKLGATHEGTLRRERTIWTGHSHDTTIWSIMADEWRK